MHPLLDKYLCDKYPKLFRDRHKSMRETCMCWGLECNSGWFFLIERTCAMIQAHVDEIPYVPNKAWSVKLKCLWNRTVWNWICYPILSKLPYEKYQHYRKYWNFDIMDQFVPGEPIPQVVFMQIKEKFAGLRMYYQGGDEHIASIIRFAETLSYSICEDCGKMNHEIGRNQVGWQVTSCKEHDRGNETFTLKYPPELIEIWKTIEKEKNEHNTKTG